MSLLNSRAAAVALMSALGATGCIVGEDGDDVVTAEGGGSKLTWNTVKANKQAVLDKYLADNAEDFKWFKNAPVGKSGIPMVMFRLFPELFPEIWGPESSSFASIGLGKDTIEPARVLPLGLGYMGSEPPVATPAGPVNVQVVQLSCAGCHNGRVIGPAGETIQIIGGPSTTFTMFRQLVGATVQHPGYTAERFRAALATKPAGWLYGGDPAMAQQEALERAIFNAPGGAEQFLDALKARVIAGGQRFAATIGAHTYDAPSSPNPNGRKPGYLDALSAGMAVVIDPAQYTSEQLDAILPAAPAEIDIMSVWLQKDRPTAQWDGSIESPLHRNLGAEFGVIGNPQLLNMENAVRTTRFTENLPPTPYPFNVDLAKAARGALLYQENCGGCHAPGNDNFFGPDDIGTDPNRANVWSETTATALANAIKAGCTDTVACANPDGSPVSNEQIANATGAYMAVPLDGIWARAPYLHNGSVPTLHALLTGDRPTTFYRGNLTYDQAKVGFSYTAPTTPGAALYDTRLSGLRNTGHLGPRYNGGVDWKSKPDKLADLLEYLKTI